MYQGYVLRVFIAYLFIIGSIMLLRTEVVLSQLQALAKEPSLLFSLGFIGLVMGLALVMAKKLSCFERFLSMLILIKSILVVAFPLWFAQGLLFFATPKLVAGWGIFFIILGFNLGIYQRYFHRTSSGDAK